MHARTLGWLPMSCTGKLDKLYIYSYASIQRKPSPPTLLIFLCKLNLNGFTRAHSKPNFNSKVIRSHFLLCLTFFFFIHFHFLCKEKRWTYKCSHFVIVYHLSNNTKDKTQHCSVGEATLRSLPKSRYKTV